MLSWLPRQRARTERVEAEAEALIRDLGLAAYSEARRREREASSDAIAKDWGRVALAVAHKTGKRIGLDTSTRMAINAVFAPDREWAAARERRPYSELRPVEELTRIVGPKLKPFRIQFVGAAPDGGKSVSKEVEILRLIDRPQSLLRQISSCGRLKRYDCASSMAQDAKSLDDRGPIGDRRDG